MPAIDSGAWRALRVSLRRAVHHAAVRIFFQRPSKTRYRSCSAMKLMLATLWLGPEVAPWPQSSTDPVPAVPLPENRNPSLGRKRVRSRRALPASHVRLNQFRSGSLSREGALAWR
jgi:hypothetical protein